MKRLEDGRENGLHHLLAEKGIQFRNDGEDGTLGDGSLGKELLHRRNVNGEGEPVTDVRLVETVLDCPTEFLLRNELRLRLVQYRRARRDGEDRGDVAVERFRVD